MNKTVNIPSEMRYVTNASQVGSAGGYHTSNSSPRTKASRAAKKTIRRPRGKGDPRMNRAVEARKANPSLTLLDALLIGGFVFPTMGQPGITDKTCYDPESVSLYQRKNQLNRRLRYLKNTKIVASGKTDTASPPQRLQFEKTHPSAPSFHGGAQSESLPEVVSSSSRCYEDCSFGPVVDTVTSSSSRQEECEVQKQETGSTAESFATVLNRILQEASDAGNGCLFLEDESGSKQNEMDAAAQVSPEDLLPYRDEKDVAYWKTLLMPVSDFQF